MICKLCGEEFVLYPKKPGLINECSDCAKDIPVYLAEQSDPGVWVVEHLTTVPSRVRTRLKEI